jgi:hypothetical protein
MEYQAVLAEAITYLDDFRTIYRRRVRLFFVTHMTGTYKENPFMEICIGWLCVPFDPSRLFQFFHIHPTFLTFSYYSIIASAIRHFTCTFTSFPDSPIPLIICIGSTIYDLRLINTSLESYPRTQVLSIRT